MESIPQCCGPASRGRVELQTHSPAPKDQTGGFIMAGGQAEQKSHVHANPCTPFPKRETFGTTPSPLHRLLSCLDLTCSGSEQKAVLIFYCLDVLARWNKGIFGTGHHQDLMVGQLVGTCAMDAAFLLFARAGDDDLSSCSSRICCCC